MSNNKPGFYLVYLYQDGTLNVADATGQENEEFYIDYGILPGGTGWIVATMGTQANSEEDAKDRFRARRTAG